MNKWFEKNFDRWKILYPEDAEKLKNHTSQVEFTSDQKNAEINALQELFKTIPLEKINVIFVFGVGTGYFYDLVENWLKNSHHFLIFLEYDLGVIRKLFETEQGNRILHNKQVRLVYFDKEQLKNQKWVDLNKLFVGKEYFFVSHPNYLQSDGDLFKFIESKILYYREFVLAYMTEYRDYAAPFYSNYYRNFNFLPEAYLAKNLAGKMRGVPAIICGAGPSLSKNLALLETLQNRALIFAGGTALNAVNSNGFVPHAGFGIDPNPEQWTRLIINNAFEIPFFYRNRMSTQALEVIQGTKLYVNGAGGHSTSEWFEKELEIVGPDMEEGFNVINFSLALACELGCNPIIFVGVDLAYTNAESYHAGVVTHPIHTRRHLFRTKDVEEELLTQIDIHGNPVLTLWKWIAESHWIGHFAQTHTQTLFINATEGGIGMPGIPNNALSDVAEQLLTNTFDYKVNLHGEILNSVMPNTVTLSRIDKLKNQLKDSLKQSYALCEQLINEYKRVGIEFALNHNMDSDPWQDSINKLKDQLHNEPAYQFLLKDFNEYFQHMHSLDFQQILYDPDASKHIKSSREVLFEALRHQYLSEAAVVQLSIIEHDFRVSESFKKMQVFEMKYPSHTEDEYVFGNGKLSIKDEQLNLNIAETYSEDELEEMLQYYPNGSIKMQSYYLKGKLHGPISFYQENGSLLARSWYVCDKQQGKARFYYHNGHLYSLQSFKNGKSTDAHYYYYPNGLLKSEIHYENGKLHGEVRLFYPNGTLKRVLHFYEGKRDGNEKYWSEEGILIIDVNYDKGMPVGTAKYWFKNGKLSEEIVYDGGKIKQRRSWDEMGLPLSQDIQDDIVDKVAKQSDLLAQSFYQIYDHLKKIAPLLSEEGKQLSELLEVDFDALQKEIADLQKLSLELKAESGLERSDQFEPIWKGPSTKKLLLQKLEELTLKLRAEIGGLQVVVRAFLEKRKKEQNDNIQDG